MTAHFAIFVVKLHSGRGAVGHPLASAWSLNTFLMSDESYYELDETAEVEESAFGTYAEDYTSLESVSTDPSASEDSPAAPRAPKSKAAPKGECVINYKGVDVERAERQVLKDVDFKLHAGEFCYLVGRVGSGKSSLMKTMYADVPIHQGDTAEVLGFDMLNLKRSKIPYLRRKIGIVFQDFQLLQDRSVADNLRFVLRATGWKRKQEIEDRIEEVLKDVGMQNKSYKMPHELSGGEQQRIVIARALLNRPQLILADEPTGNLDPQTGYQIVKLLHRLARDGHAVLMVTHNMQLVEDFPAMTVRCADKHVSLE